MIRGLTTAASGMLADERMQELLTNNLANAQTPGYKSSNGSMLEFPQQLLSAINYNGSGQRTPVGSMGTGVVLQEGVPLFTQGQITPTQRNLDVAISDSTPAGTYASVAKGSGVQSIAGTVVAGAGGRLSINGTPLAVFDVKGQPVANMYAVKNPNYQGTALTAADGKPNYDAAGNPSYVFANAQGQVVGAPGEPGFDGVAIRVGNNLDMGEHSFFPVAYQSPTGPSGIALTKDGHFDTNSNHELVDAGGNAVLPVSPTGQVLYNARIVLNPQFHGSTIFGANGAPVTDSGGQPSYRVVDQNGNNIPGARLGTVNTDVTNLTPLGQTEFMVGGTLNSAQVMPLLQKGSGQLHPGELEGSNVDVTSTMTQMLSALNNYQANLHVLQTENQILNAAVNKVGVYNA
ncbi:flagellar basal body protein [Alicyclobacillus tolerans]|uniref:flagellar basal body rod C-terminal domain-containing protein n=1 Tax=Alicyclobacillus tolerans TaxID=90970 RepID=UPI001F00EC69|nr:flagellar basal body rod C-terminal domain-containing protein [Alicyclobacillus tolerans]MCF8567479.1 flagellar basal body protein [Alicyclobacillus tolerans]